MPGAGIYYTGYHIFMNDNAAALSTGMETIKIAVCHRDRDRHRGLLPPFFFTLRRTHKKGEAA